MTSARVNRIYLNPICQRLQSAECSRPKGRAITALPFASPSFHSIFIRLSHAIAAGRDWATSHAGWDFGSNRIAPLLPTIIKTMAHAFVATGTFNFQRVLPLIRTTRLCRQTKLEKDQKGKLEK